MSRLGTVLRLREIQERTALGALGRARQELRRAEERTEERRAAYRGRPLPGLEGVSPTALRALTLQGAGALELVQEALAARDDAEGGRERALAAWSLASVSRKSTQRLVEREQEARAATARAAADRALDELAVLRRLR